MQVCERPGCAQMRVVVDNPGTPWLALTDEHDHLLGQVASRVDAVLAVARRDCWPAVELRSLVRYLNDDVLSHAAREEHLLWAKRVTPSGRMQLRRDHDRLRAATAVLARLDEGEGSRSPAVLAATARSVLVQFRRHLTVEGELLAATGARS